MAALVAPARTYGARDTEEQIKAREALRQKLAELDASPAANPTPVAPVPPPAPAVPPPPAAPTPVFAPVAAPVSVPAPTPVVTIPNSSNKAQEALRQKMAELDASPATTPTPPVAATQNAPVVPAAPVPAPAPAVTIPSSSQFAPVPDAVEDAKASRAREALRQQMSVPESAPAIATKLTKQKKSGHAPVFTETVVATAPVMEAPLSPLTGSKAARLAELLQRYNADQVTPKEYHTQRAAILAEP